MSKEARTFTKVQLNFAGFLVCGGLLAYALYAEHVLLLNPCPLCMLQRVAVGALGLVFVAAALHNPVSKAGSAFYAFLVLLAAGGGVAVAGRHVWIQNLPPDKVPACGPDWDFMIDSFPLMEALQMILSGSGECADILWSFMGLSMPAWVVIALTVIGLYGIAVNLRRT